MSLNYNQSLYSQLINDLQYICKTQAIQCLQTCTGSVHQCKVCQSDASSLSIYNEIYTTDTPRSMKSFNIIRVIHSFWFLSQNLQSNSSRSGRDCACHCHENKIFTLLLTTFKKWIQGGKGLEGELHTFLKANNRDPAQKGTHLQ